MDILIILENSQGSLHRMSREAITAAQVLGKKMNLTVGALAFGLKAEEIAETASKYELEEILLVKNDLLDEYSSDGYAEMITQVIGQIEPKLIIVGHTYQVRDVIPKVSARLKRPFISDVTGFSIDGGTAVFHRQMFGAKLSAEIVASGDGTTIVSFQSAAFQADQAQPGSTSIKEISVSLTADQIKVHSEAPFQEEAGGVDLSSANLIVSIGRGIGKEENIPLVKALTEALKGELACSRPIVDASWLPGHHQVGSSGQTVSPKLYLALGISGAIQHMVGMKGSKNIVAINKDPEAPIFEIADYGIVGDILEILPKLTEAIKEA